MFIIIFSLVVCGVLLSIVVGVYILLGFTLGMVI